MRNFSDEFFPSFTAAFLYIIFSTFSSLPLPLPLSFYLSKYRLFLSISQYLFFLVLDIDFRVFSPLFSQIRTSWLSLSFSLSTFLHSHTRKRKGAHRRELFSGWTLKKPRTCLRWQIIHFYRLSPDKFFRCRQKKRVCRLDRNRRRSSGIARYKRAFHYFSSTALIFGFLLFHFCPFYLWISNNAFANCFMHERVHSL